MQLCNEDNAFLVDWARGYVEETVGPYEQGRPWAEPDLDQAAAVYNRVTLRCVECHKYVRDVRMASAK